MHWQSARSTLLASVANQARLGLISDFDGTLSPIVQNRDQASISTHKVETLAALAKHLPLVALVSGRCVADLQARVGLSDLVYVGNHGLERWVDNQVVVSPEALSHQAILEASIKNLELEPGMEVENKGASLAIHYRLTSNSEQIEQTYSLILRDLAAQHGLKFSQGRMIFELKPPVEINKGTTLVTLAQEYQLDGLIFLGDDTTDVDAMKAAHLLRETQDCQTVNLGVESAEMPSAIRDYSDLLLLDPDDVEVFLDWLLGFISRKAS